MFASMIAVRLLIARDIGTLVVVQVNAWLPGCEYIVDVGFANMPKLTNFSIKNAQFSTCIELEHGWNEHG
jgi:hypothetical protein